MEFSILSEIYLLLSPIQCSPYFLILYHFYHSARFHLLLLI